jgi:L-alanine-DL-glutamate epimerase-like enolase superfamily enzyme
MKIVAVETLELVAKLDIPWKISRYTFSEMTATLVRITCDNGKTGVGECLTRLGPGVTAEIVRSIFAPILIGSDPRNIEALWEEMYLTMRPRGHSRGFLLEAISGVDIALWDLAGQTEGRPIWQLLNGYGRKELKVYASSVMIDTPSVMADEAEKLVSSGYRALKLKIGRDGVRADIERIRAVRKAVGDDIEIMLDANSAYDVVSAIQVGRAAEKEGVFWLEEPVMPDNLDGYKKIKSALTDIRLAAGEGEFAPGGFKTLLVDGLIDIAQPDISRAGGFTGSRRIAALADAFDTPVCPHTGASGPVCIAASMHLAASIPQFMYFEDMFVFNPLHEVFKYQLPKQQNGVIQVPTGPGLGIEYDEASLIKNSCGGKGWKLAKVDA